MLTLYNGREEIEQPQNHLLCSLMQDMDATVQRCADKAYSIDALDEGRPKQRLWKSMVSQFMASGGETAGFQYARYGYAVEDMANVIMTNQYSNGMNGFTIKLQDYHNETIPDIVILGGGGKEVAWLDITSYTSRGHIFHKGGSQWRTREFVGELLYPPFDRTNLRASNESGIGVRAGVLAMARALEMRQHKVEDICYEMLGHILGIFSQRFPETKAEVAAVFEEVTGESFPLGEKHKIIKSSLKQYVSRRGSFLNSYGRVAREVLNRFYKDGSESKSASTNYFSAILNRTQKKQQRYETFVDDFFDVPDDFDHDPDFDPGLFF